jgi:site-specific DNA recombinase
MLSGLLKCGCCGGGLTSIGERKGRARIQCSTYKESGSCQNGRRIKRDDVEQLALDALRAELRKPAYLVEYVKAYNEEHKRLARDASNAGANDCWRSLRR